MSGAVSKTLEERAREIWHRITEEASFSNFHGVEYDGDKIDQIISAALVSVRNEEREACAKIADAIQATHKNTATASSTARVQLYHLDMSQGAGDVAEAIRARSD